MIEVSRAAAELQAVCVTNAWGFCFIGGLALQRWGEPRETVDDDLSLSRIDKYAPDVKLVSD
jgi:hypothetical protein